MPLRFTEELVADLRCPAGQRDKLFFDDKQKGLGIRVTQTGGKVFIVQWTDPATGQKRREVLALLARSPSTKRARLLLPIEAMSPKGLTRARKDWRRPKPQGRPRKPPRKP